MARFIFTLSAFASFFLVAGVVFAQSTVGQPDPVRFLVAPEVPAPGDAVIIEVQGVGDFLDAATITWQLGGKTVLSGIGENTFSFTVGGLGTQSRVHVIVSSPSRGTITRDFAFLPSLVHMLWEADTTVPPWYKGKALYSAGSRLTVFALPQIVVSGATVSSNNLSFDWQRNGTPLANLSGRGRSSITIDGNQLYAAETISVTVRTGETVLGRGEITIPASKPQIVLYERDPLRGTLLDTALANTVSLSSTEITVEAQAYFFAKSSAQSGSLPYVWTLNNKETTGPDTSRGLLTLRQTGSGAGAASLGVSIQNNDSDKLVQSAQTLISIVFGGATSGISSFFGL